MLSLSVTHTHTRTHAYMYFHTRTYLPPACRVCMCKWVRTYVYNIHSGGGGAEDGYEHQGLGGVGALSSGLMSPLTTPRPLLTQYVKALEASRSETYIRVYV